MNLTPEIRDALEGTLSIAEHNLTQARAQYELRAAQAQEAAREVDAHTQTVTAIRATLGEERPILKDFPTFGDE